MLNKKEIWGFRIAFTLLFSLLFFIFLPMISAETELHKVNTDVYLTFTCTLNDEIPSSGTEFNITITYPNGTILIDNQNTTSLGSGLFSYETNFPINGIYGLKQFCYDSNYSYSNSNDNYKITPTGTDLSLQQSILFIGILSLLLLFMVGGVYGLSRSIDGAWTIFYICLGYLSLFAIFFICWLYSSNYLYETPIISSIFWIFWLIMGYGFFPFIISISVYIIGKGVKDNLVKEYVSQGYTKEEAIEMAKRKRH